MKKARIQKPGEKPGELRTEYARSDFPGGLTRGKYAARVTSASNVVVLEPDVAKAFPNSRAVNEALQSLLRLAKAHVRKRA